MAKKKGPTWEQINAPGANNIEARQSGGYLRKITQMGKTRVVLRCPFCKGEVTAYVWSLSGGGKRCGCGAMAGGEGTFYHFADRGQA